MGSRTSGGSSADGTIDSLLIQRLRHRSPPTTTTSPPTTTPLPVTTVPSTPTTTIAAAAHDATHNRADHDHDHTPPTTMPSSRLQPRPRGPRRHHDPTTTPLPATDRDNRDHGSAIRLSRGQVLTATVSPAPGGGTVAFSVDGQGLAEPVPVDRDGTATASVDLTDGPHPVTATYSGTSEFASSSVDRSSLLGRPPRVDHLGSVPLRNLDAICLERHPHERRIPDRGCVGVVHCPRQSPVPIDRRIRMGRRPVRSTPIPHRHRSWRRLVTQPHSWATHPSPRLGPLTHIRWQALEGPASAF